MDFAVSDVGQQLAQDEQHNGSKLSQINIHFLYFGSIGNGHAQNCLGKGLPRGAGQDAGNTYATSIVNSAR